MVPSNIDLRAGTSSLGLDTDIPRIHEGLLGVHARPVFVSCQLAGFEQYSMSCVFFIAGGQFWSVYIGCDKQGKDAVRKINPHDISN